MPGLQLQFGLGLKLRGADGLAGVAPTAPVNTVAPAITGAAQEGQTLNCSTGTWSNSPTSYAYQWMRGGVAISGATASTYTCVTADIGSTISCTVAASNGSTAYASTAPTSPVTAASTPYGQLDFSNPDQSGLIPGL